MAPVAARLDEDGSLDAWIFADRSARLPSLTIPELPRWVPENVPTRLPVRDASPQGRGRKIRRREGLGYGNNEPVVIRDVIDFCRARPTGRPMLVLFFSDGGVYENKEISDLLREASALPIFWQFVGLGESNYGILEDLDTLPGRVVDNAGFFAVDDIDSVSDEELYDRLLGEFPQWLRAARAAGVLT
ncbi:hypothetical protein GCM10022254_17070 [Actinomadura meridiana]|uniref:vWA found in TerF C terminus domain-containing protein n=2 Tax=Actinomadura meridiana TaxID=559626 RepID=A0ABP8BVW5_9ACTN